MDPFCPWNEGRYLLEAIGGDVNVTPATTEPPDITCSVNEIGATYLGGASFRQLHRAGRVDEHTGDALARADALFGWDPAPWCPYIF
jgi:predicted acetyltransferase